MLVRRIKNIFSLKSISVERAPCKNDSKMSSKHNNAVSQIDAQEGEKTRKRKILNRICKGWR